MNFLENFFYSINEDKISYVVLRNYYLLPYSTGDSDLDILINYSEKSKFYKRLIKIAGKYNGSIISQIDSNTCPRICLLGLDWGIMIDLHFEEINYGGTVLVSNKNIWKNTIIYNDSIYILNKKTDSLIGFFKELLNNQNVTKKYFLDFKKYCLNRDYLNEIFENRFSKVTAKILELEYLDHSGDKFKNQLGEISQQFPKNSVPYFEKIKKIKRLLNQPGHTITFLGTDGSGKSTIIENINGPLNGAFHNAVYYEHMRPNYIPSLSRLFGKKEFNEGPVTDPHASSSSGIIGSLIRWGYYLLDYTLGYLIKVFPKKAIRSCVFIFDRYYYDFIIDPKRSRIKLPKWILKIGQFLIPEPDIIICLGTEAETIRERKPELPIEEIERQDSELKRFAEKHKRAVWVDTGVSVEESSEKTMEVIIKVMSKRFEHVKL